MDKPMSDSGGSSNVNINNNNKAKNLDKNPETGSVMDALNITNSILAILIIYVLYKLFAPKKRQNEEEEKRWVLPPPLPKHDMTLDELIKYDGKGPDKRICLAILGTVYDCTKGYSFYGPGGAYCTLAGRDATRALARFDVFAVKDEWDDCTDLSPNETSQAMEWSEQFKEKYDIVGRLVRSKEEIIERPDFEEELNENNENNAVNGDSNEKTDDNSKQSSETSNIATATSSSSSSGNNKKVSFSNE